MARKSYLILLLGALCLCGAGCHIDLSETTAETDASVYAIIDSQWDDELATKTNYRIPEASDASDSILFPDEPALEQRVLTLAQAVDAATRHNRQYQTEKENLYLVALDFTEVRHLYEPMPFMGADGGYRKDGDSEASGGFGNVGFEQLLATGAHIGGNISLGWMDIITGDFRSGFSSVASAMITQPLLRGAGRKVALENLTQAERNTLYQIRAFNRYRKTFVTAIISDYYSILQLNDQKNNARDYYCALYDIHKKLQKRAIAGKVPSHELEQADQDKLQALTDWIQIRKDYKNALDSFKMQLALPVSRELQLDMNELDVLRQAITDTIDLTEEEAIEVALNQRLDLANAADIVIDAERKVDVAADAIRAELNLIGYASPQTSGRTVFGNDPGELEVTQKRYQLSAQLDLPIDRLKEKNAYRKALIVLMQQQRSSQELTDTVVLEIREAYRQMEEAYERYQVKLTSSELAQKRTQNTLLLLKYGRVNTRDVLDAQEDLFDAQNEMTGAMLDYTIASLKFYRDTGTMKIRPDGMWEK